jgi:methionine-gamma-lyase
MNHFGLFSLAVSLGDTESLIEHPASMTHRDYPRETLAAFGFSDRLVRISAGLESTEDLLRDLEQALSKI